MDLVVYDKNLQRKGPIGYWTGKVTLQYLQPGRMQFTVGRDNPRWADLNAVGARVVAEIDGTPVMSGAVQSRSGESTSTDWDITVIDDLVMATGVLIWPNPDLPITGQTSAYKVSKGFAETVVKNLITANQPAPNVVTAAATQGRGPRIVSTFRWHKLLDRIDLEHAGLGLKVVQTGGQIVADVWETATHSRVYEWPVVAEWSASWNAPTVTRVIAAAQGAGVARQMRLLADFPTETSWRIAREAFIDARDIDTLDVDQSAELDDRMAAALAAGAATVSAKAVLAEADHFRWGTGYQLGDILTLRLDPSMPLVTERIRKVEFICNGDSLTVTPYVGDLLIDYPELRATARLRGRVDSLERSP